MIQRTDLSIGQTLVKRGPYGNTTVIVVATEPWKAVNRRYSRYGRETFFAPATTRSAKGTAVATLGRGDAWVPMVVSLDDLLTVEASQATDERVAAERAARRRAEARRIAAQERIDVKIPALYSALRSMDGVRHPFVSPFSGGEAEINEAMLDEIMEALALRDSLIEADRAMAEAAAPIFPTSPRRLVTADPAGRF